MEIHSAVFGLLVAAYPPYHEQQNDEPGIIVVILDNAYLGLICQDQKTAYGYGYGVDMPYDQDGRVDYVKVAEGFGCRAERVFGGEELAQTIERAKSSQKRTSSMRSAKRSSCVVWAAH